MTLTKQDLERFLDSAPRMARALIQLVELKCQDEINKRDGVEACACIQAVRKIIAES